MYNIINNTAHEVNIVANATFNPDIRKYQGGQIIATFERGKMLNAKTELCECPSIAGVPISTYNVISIDRVNDADYHIVSMQYVSACQKLGIDTSRLLTVSSAVVDDDGKVVGCIGLIKN